MLLIAGDAKLPVSGTITENLYGCYVLRQHETNTLLCASLCHAPAAPSQAQTQLRAQTRLCCAAAAVGRLQRGAKASRAAVRAKHRVLRSLLRRLL